MPSAQFKPVLYRFELSPPRPHTNKLHGEEEINGLVIDAGVPHEHVFYDSLRSDGALRSRLDEQGRIVTNPTSDLAISCAYVCSGFNIPNGGGIPSLKK